MSYAHIEKLEKQYEEEVKRLMELAQEADSEKVQYIFTDPESRIMKTSDGFDQCYNAQAAVTDEMIIVGGYATDHCNDKGELNQVLDSIPEELDKVETATADTGYFSETAVEGCEERGVDAHIATGRQKHNGWLGQKQNPPSRLKLPISHQNNPQFSKLRIA